MPILTTDTKKILYIHVPKTGGTFVENLLRSYGNVSGVRYGSNFGGLPCSPQHFHGELLENMFSLDHWTVEHDFDFVFMTVRDPVKRLESEFRYRKSSGNFDSWLKTTLSSYQNNPFIYDNHIRPQSQFFAFDASVFRLEDGLDKVRVKLDEVTGVSGSTPTQLTNQSKHHGNFALSQPTKRRLAKHVETDALLYGYHVPLA